LHEALKLDNNITLTSELRKLIWLD
jgi:hypothetical protein